MVFLTFVNTGAGINNVRENINTLYDQNMRMEQKLNEFKIKYDVLLESQNDLLERLKQADSK